MAFYSYQSLNSLGVEFFTSEIQISNATISQLLENYGFLLLFGIFTVCSILVCFYIVPRDRFGGLRKRLLKSSAPKTIWHEIVADEEHRGFAVVETNDSGLIVGFLKRYSEQQGKREIILKYPEKYNMDTLECTPIQNVEYILFKEQDIKRVYFMSKTDF